MSKKKDTPEQVVSMLREAEVQLGKGQSIAEVCRGLGITDQTYSRWRKEYGGLRVDQAKRLKELEQENSRLKKVVADLILDKAILKEAALVCRRLVREAEAAVQESCLELRLRGGPDERWTAAEDPDTDRRVHARVPGHPRGSSDQDR